MTVRNRFSGHVDRLLAFLLGTLVLGTTLSFGGAVWWIKPALAAATLALLAAWLVRVGLSGRLTVLRSPIAALGGCLLAVALFQLLPLPGKLVGKLSPRSFQAHALGVMASEVLEDDPTFEMPAPSAIRTPVSVDRSATLRWLGGGIVCLAVFCVAGQFADRFGHAVVIWGSVVGGLFVSTIFALVQLPTETRGMYGFVKPGEGVAWGPSTSDLLDIPNRTVMRPTAAAKRDELSWAMPHPDRPAAIGSLMGGPGAYLALGSLGLPLALGLAFQLMAPRGSREALVTRLRLSNRLGLVVVLTMLTALSALMIGVLAGPILVAPFLLGVVLVGLPTALSTGLRWTAAGITAAVLIAMAAGIGLGQLLEEDQRASPSAEQWRTVAGVWNDAAEVARDFPILGVGFGGFASVQPYYKSSDISHTSALSSVLQWWAESGLVGVLLVLLGIGWGLFKLPAAWRRVGGADRAMVYGLIGAFACFGLFSMIHWSIQLTAVALAASAVAGTANRWLSGGTDLFLERV